MVTILLDDERDRARSNFLQPRPERCRLDPQAAAGARRAITALRKQIAQCAPAAPRAILLVEARQSSRIEGVDGEPTPGGENRPSYLYHALNAALYGQSGLRECHRILWADLAPRHALRPGQWRARQVWVGSYRPPPAGAVPDMMQAFQQWANAPDGEKDNLLKAIWGHAWFESIHPFSDGNGRIGRLWMNAILDLPCTVSRSIRRRRQEYYDWLSAGDWDNWQAYMLAIIAEAARETAYDLRRHDPSQPEPDAVVQMAERYEAPRQGRRPISNEEAQLRQMMEASFAHREMTRQRESDLRQRNAAGRQPQ